ncbi:MAG: NifB/NifX family molybdenum-iron cluster-binding protein [Planctomycetota bacterium]
MKIAFSSRGPTLDSEIDPRFGRAGMFLIIDTSNQDLIPINNEQNVQAAQGAGIQTAVLVADAGADVVITGHCGPKAFRTLSAAGISVVVGAEGTVKEALEKFQKGSLRPTDSPDVEGHWK